MPDASSPHLDLKLNADDVFVSWSTSTRACRRTAQPVSKLRLVKSKVLRTSIFRPTLVILD